MTRSIPEGYLEIAASLRLTLIAKHPMPGKVKTRLTTELTPEVAALVQEAFVLHWGERLAMSGGPLPAVYFDPAEAADEFAKLMPESLRPVCSPQPPGNLGERLQAIAREMATPLPFCPMFIGADSPDVPEKTLMGALKAVRRGRVVVGPAGDGGFWCLGLGPSVDAAVVLTGIEWSSGQEQAQVVAAARRGGYDVVLAGMWDDVDRPDDLRRLLRRLKKSRDRMDRRLLQRLSFLPGEFWA